MAHAIDPALVQLCDENLTDLPRSVSCPVYDRASLIAGIVHIGLGNFHRAHQAWYLHRLMQNGEALDWAIVGAGVRPHDEKQRQKLAEQDYLTTLVELDPQGTSAEIIGPMIDFVPVQPSNQQLIERMAQPDIRIVSLTVTEGGYYVDPVAKTFDATHPDIQHDVAHPESPTTAFGAMVAALKIRKDRGTGPFTGLSCDNLQGNGAVLRQTVVSLARLTEPELADWIDKNCSFPNSMVDCIVPATGLKEIELVRSLGISDASPVTHENYRQWVIEDDFCAGRPDLNKVGATFTDHVHDYEAMKIRILNGGHQIIAGVGEILSVATIADCMANAKIRSLFRRIALNEIAPHVKPVPGTTPKDYVDLIDHRFSNPRIIDTTRRVAFDGSSRHPGFVIPTIREGIAAGTPIEGLALVEAAWARMCEGTREDGSRIEPNDPIWDDLQKTAVLAKADPSVWLKQQQYYGDLVYQPQFANAFSNWLNMIWSKGVEAAVDHYLKG
ncbi:mannitol dehydrogenase family protein [Aliiroseovarius sp. S2029]|uniref:mannitol dehydrogenase family protein n=1 Tax=Aliiroseovarius sp. S2029 TaxID=2936988 RepID=UPI0020BE33FD|nr:mannitol dehydrogenase family protein [Aliiroseovarius sp. S2029]MCK8484338.1 mannitol dehydrogenase family protein [Aliiroseovarius sp. S2029]